MAGLTVSAASLHHQGGRCHPGIGVARREPGNQVNLAELYTGKKGVLSVGFPKIYLLGFVEKNGAGKAKGAHV